MSERNTDLGSRYLIIFIPGGYTIVDNGNIDYLMDKFKLIYPVCLVDDDTISIYYKDLSLESIDPNSDTSKPSDVCTSIIKGYKLMEELRQFPLDDHITLNMKKCEIEYNQNIENSILFSVVFDELERIKDENKRIASMITKLSTALGFIKRYSKT